eukprot:1841282-Prymnesium_polylepis.1
MAISDTKSGRRNRLWGSGCPVRCDGTQPSIGWLRAPPAPTTPPSATHLVRGSGGRRASLDTARAPRAPVAGARSRGWRQPSRARDCTSRDVARPAAVRLCHECCCAPARVAQVEYEEFCEAVASRMKKGAQSGARPAEGGGLTPKPPGKPKATSLQE